MPNHWESSARPLFVKTVFVNGNRHAVLFEKDPLLRCGNSSFKKASRPNSSVSFTSEFSVSSSEREESKAANQRQRQSRDLSTELQSCLVKLKIASVSKSKSREEKCVCSSKESERSQSRGSSNQKRQKRNRERRKQSQLEEESGECDLSERKNGCYIYNLENYKRKKNYCFVKISSQPPKLILNCCCDNSETHTCNQNNKKMVISATIRNLVMTPEVSGNVFPFESGELYWNNYVTRSYYNSLSERVFRWLEVVRKKKKQKDKLDSALEGDSAEVTERIFSGKAFAEEIKRAECSYKYDNKVRVNGDKVTRNDTSEEDAEDEVTVESNLATLLSDDSAGKNYSFKTFEKSVRGFQSEREHSSENSSTRSYFCYPLVSSKESTARQFNTSRSTNSSLKVQDLLLNFPPQENYNQRKTKEIRNPKFNEVEDDEGGVVIRTLNAWTGGTSKKSVFVDKFDKQPRCQCNRKLDEHADKIKNQILTESLPERNQKSINNLNNTRGRPVLIQNLLSPQQPNKMSYLEEEKIVWASEKNTGRPQLHIFMPSVLLKDPSDDNVSERENYLNL